MKELLNNLLKTFNAQPQRQNYFLEIKHYNYYNDPKIVYYSGFPTRLDAQNFQKHQEDNKNQLYKTGEYNREYKIIKGSKLLKENIFLAQPKENLL